MVLRQNLFLKLFACETECHYNVRQCNDFRISLIRTVYHGSESICFLGPKIWNILPDEIKQQSSLNSFKKSLKNGNRQIAYVDCAKFILMVSDSFLSHHKCKEVYFVLNFILFYPTDVDLFTFTTLMSKMTLLC